MSSADEPISVARSICSLWLYALHRKADETLAVLQDAIELYLDQNAQPNCDVECAVSTQDFAKLLGVVSCLAHDLVRWCRWECLR